MAAESYLLRKESQMKLRNQKDKYLSSVQRVHNHHASNLNYEKEKHDDLIKRLEQREQQMVQNLQTTLIQKNVAISHLQSKSPSLKKSIQPRLAYRYNSHRGIPNTSRDGASSQGGEDQLVTSQLSLRKKNILHSPLKQRE
jgi:hypothetical protein